MTNVNETVIRYIAAWNERDPKRRLDLVAATWSEDGSYIDAHRHGKGHGAIDAMLAATQEQFPGYRLNLVSGIEAHNNFARFSWAAGGTQEAPLYLGGTDFATLGADGRIKIVTGFTDAAPAPMK
jgi:SnoaL-like domain